MNCGGGGRDTTDLAFRMADKPKDPGRCLCQRFERLKRILVDHPGRCTQRCTIAHPPSRHGSRAALASTLRTLDDAGSRQAHVQRFGIFSAVG